jgi:hypothetical protein
MHSSFDPQALGSRPRRPTTAQVVWSNTSRSLDIVFDEIASEIRGWGLHAVHWWVTSSTHPLDTEAYLLARGGVLSDSYQILARELGGDVAESVAPDGMSVELVRDERSLRAAILVETQGWGRAPSDKQAIGHPSNRGSRPSRNVHRLSDRGVH